MDNAEVLRRVQQLRKALAEKRKKLEKQEAKLSRRTSAPSSITEPRQHQEESQTNAALGPSPLSPACRSPSSSFRVEEEEIPLSLFQSQFFPSLFTQLSQTDRPQDCTVLCVPRAAASLSEDEQTIDFVTARSSTQEPPSLATCLTSHGTALVFVLRTLSTDVVPLWRKSASEGTKPLAVCLITLPSTPSSSTRVGLFLLCFHVHQEVLINCLYVAEVTEEGTWNLLDSLILPISVKSRVLAADVSSLTGCADAVFVTGLGFIIAIVVPAIGLTATFRASLEVETFVLLGHGFQTAHFPPQKALARLCFVSDSHDCLALLWDAMLQSLAAVVLPFDPTTYSHSRMSFYPLCLEEDSQSQLVDPGGHLRRLFSLHAVLLSAGPCPSYVLTTVLQGVPVSGQTTHDYLLAAVLPLEGPKLTPPPSLIRLLPSEDMTTWNIFGDSPHQVLARLRFQPVDSPNAEHRLTLWSVADWLKSPPGTPITEAKLLSQTLSPSCIGAVVFEWTATERENQETLPSRKFILPHVLFTYF